MSFWRKVAVGAREGPGSAPLSPVGKRRLQRLGQGCRLGSEGFGLDGRDRQTPAESGSARRDEGVGQRMGQAGDDDKLAEASPLTEDFRAFLPRRWVVERSFSWLGQNRRMNKDYERLMATSEVFVYVAMTRLMLKRLARA